MNKTTVIGVLVFLLFLLSGIAVFSLVKLNQLGVWPVRKAPSKEEKSISPGEQARAPEIYQQEEADVCRLAFTVAPLPTCYQNDCTQSPDNCPTDLACQNTTEGLRCVNPDCPDETDCVCPPPVCWENKCTQSPDNCPTGMACQNTTEGLRCVNPDCPEDKDCTCPPACYQYTCTQSPDNCPTGMACQNTTEGLRCVNPDCPDETDCVCPPPVCWQNKCSQSPDNCPSGMTCQNTTDGLRCVNSECPEDKDCACDLACYQYTCSVNPDNCPSGMACQNTTQGLRCVNPDCPDETDCVCPRSFVCVDLSSDLASVQIGSQLNFTCSHAAENVDFDHYEFRWSYTGGTTWQNLDLTNTSGSSGPHTISQPGDCIVQCRACAATGSNPCTDWGQAGGWVE